MRASHVSRRFSDVPLGLYVIRGENVVLLGQMDDAKDAVTTGELLERVEVDVILEAKAAQDEERKLKARRRAEGCPCARRIRGAWGSCEAACDVRLWRAQVSMARHLNKSADTFDFDF